MKTCNGCKNLRISESFNQADRYFCGIEFKEIGWFMVNDDIPTPYWCPKKNENIQKEALNVN